MDQFMRGICVGGEASDNLLARLPASSCSRAAGGSTRNRKIR